MDMFDIEPRPLPSSRRLRDEPVDTATSLVEQFGSRAATSLGEAQAAAYYDGRLRRAGLRVSADAVEAPAWSGWDSSLLAGWLVIAVALYRWQPLVAVIMDVLGLVVACYGILHGGSPLFAKRMPSQNIIGTRALAQKPRKRVVLLAPMDSPPQMPPLVRLIQDGDRPWVGRSIACVVVLVLALAGMGTNIYALKLFCWYAQFLPCMYVVITAGLDIWLWRAPATPGAVNHAGALATLLAVAEELTSARQIELWVVALGATQSGSGLANLLRRYPFEPEQTRFIALEGIGSGTLAYFTRAGLVRHVASDAELLALVAAADADDPVINAEPHPLRLSPTILGSLRRGKWRAVGIGCVGPDGKTPYRGSPQDTPAVLDADLLDRTVRLVVSLVRKIDSAED